MKGMLSAEMSNNRGPGGLGTGVKSLGSVIEEQ